LAVQIEAMIEASSAKNSPTTVPVLAYQTLNGTLLLLFDIFVTETITRHGLHGSN